MQWLWGRQGRAQGRAQGGAPQAPAKQSRAGSAGGGEGDGDRTRARDSDSSAFRALSLEAHGGRHIPASGQNISASLLADRRQVGKVIGNVRNNNF